jgi:hypothetical protein
MAASFYSSSVFAASSSASRVRKVEQEASQLERESVVEVLGLPPETVQPKLRQASPQRDLRR